MSNIDEKIWRALGLAKLKQQFKQWFNRDNVSYVTYGTVAGLALWPLVEAAAQAPPGQLPASLYIALGSVAGGVGSNLIAEQLQRWRDRAAPVTENDVIAWIRENVAARGELLTALDAINARFDTFTAAQDSLAPADQDAFWQKLRQELAQLGNTPQYEAILQGKGVIVQGEGAAVGDIFTGTGNTKVNGPYYEHYHEAAPGEAVDLHSLRRTYLGRLLEQTRFLPLSGIDRASVEETTETQNAGRLPLKTVYTALLTTSSEGGPFGGEMPGLLGRGQGKAAPISALRQLDRQQHLVLLGDPGSGKSTFANFVAACLAGAGLDHAEINLDLLTHPLPDEKGDDEAERQPWSHGPLLPLLVTLRDLAAEGLPAPQEAATADHLWAFLENHGGTPAFTPYLKQEFEQRGGLLLLDGLDEVPEADRRRRQIRDLVADLKATLPHARILVTSRVYAYQHQEWTLSGFTATLLAPFSWGQIRRFIDRWYTYTAALRGWTENKARQDAAHLRETIAARAELRDLAERPLLLTLMTSLHAWRGGTLPGKRAQLYDETVDLLLDKWENLRAVKDPATGRPLNKSLAEMLKVGRDPLRDLLQKLAYEAHAAQPDPASGQAVDIPENVLINALLSVSKREDLQPRLLEAYLRDRAGLLIDRGGGVYTFPHRTFQEFLAACYAADRQRSEAMTTAARSDPSRWREVLLLSVAHASKSYTGAVWDFVPCLCLEEADTLADGRLTETEAWGAHLAGLALAEVAIDPTDVGARDKPVLRRVRERLLLAMRDGRLPAVERAQASVSLARLGDPRRQVLEVDAMPFCYVPPGPFQMGEDQEYQEDDPNIQAILNSVRPRHEVDIPYGYWLGQYPVTNAQFQAFVEEGGYEDARNWEEAIAHGFWKAGAAQGYTWLAETRNWEWRTLDRPHDYGHPFNLPNHPVVGVNWYEALAFTRWLTRRWQAAGILPGAAADVEWRVCLPSEAEWEKGARGGAALPETPPVAALAGLPTLTPLSRLRRAAADEPAWGPEQANQRSSKIEATSGVGCFPAGRSPYGCEEMVGNVWEWTRSLYGRYDAEKSRGGTWTFDPLYAYPYRPDDGRERPDRDSYWGRILRGGSWADDQPWPRCGSRYLDHPDSRFDHYGFRVCARPCARNGLLSQ